MIRVEDLVTTDIEAYLHQHEHKSLLRFITCGSVDDGKSTLIGRLLYESKMLFEDQLAAVEADSKKWGTNGAEIDFALLVDGLAAEREQGITIDVAYRFFTTEKRKFIVADTPGHEQYTRNMVTGASTADVAILLVDARRGILTQTRRHSFLVRSLGIRKVVVAINKMDLVGFSKDVYDQIEADFRKFAERIDLKDITTIPMSAREGDNITNRSERTPWYTGVPLVEFLETCEIDDERVQRTPFRLPVQWVNRPNLDFRGFCGLVVGGRVQPGEEIVVLPSGRKTKVAKIVAYSGDLDDAVAGESVTLTLTDEVDVSRGDMICHASAPAEVADQFEVTIVWMAEAPMLPGRPYLMKIGANTVPATVTDLKHQIDVNTLDHLAAKQLDLNGIGVCNIALDRSIPFDPYEANRDTGGFILIDRITNATVGAGMIHFALRRAHNLHPSPTAVDKGARAKLDGHKPGVVWLTGLPSAGKSTIANAVDVRLHALGVRTALLDGDNLRRGLNRDLGFTEGDRVENVRRVAEVAKLMVDAGLIVLVAVIAPVRSERQLARELVAEGEFVEVHVDTPLAVAEQRDTRGLYAKARRGELPNFTGVNSPYEPPEHPELHLDLSTFDADAAAERVVQLLRDRGVIG